MGGWRMTSACPPCPITLASCPYNRPPMPMDHMPPREMREGRRRFMIIKVFDYNEKAKHVLATHGFVQEGTLRRDFYREGTYHDLVILSAFRDGVPEASLQ